ncbi:PorT family protein [Belliella sp. R4-6]|uniref:PorT family protein n=1 Tax=Belliella alkalica TaxID=1730871 RepID=A0ABS9VC39_9BACT|nr:outer membrane beta-barrel protein [Belliella alkalica]MCH7413438.1 PorT family protein [Belliella alkalica]
MQTFDFRYKLDLYRRKIILTAFIFSFSIISVFSQARFGEISKAGQDDKLLSYGFFLSGHNNYWRLKYSEDFLTDRLETNLKSIVPVYTQGFSLGFLANFRLHDQLNLIFTPKVGFYEFRTEINALYDIDPSLIQVGPDSNLQILDSYTVINEATMVEFPLLFKYKAQRFNNSRMFFTAGGSAMFRTKNQEEADIEEIATLGRDFTIDMGVGFDMYFKYFKFSPEVRFSHGMLDMYREEATNPFYANQIQSLRRKSITLYLNFQ